MTNEELRRKYYKQINAVIEKRPFNLEKQEDGCFNYVHHLKVRIIINELLTKLEAGDRAVEALKEIQKFNDLKNDTDAYCYQIIEWGIGKINDKPDADDYFPHSMGCKEGK